MIPKIIHYCWFGPNKQSTTIQNCIKSWKKYLPDYEIKLWNESNSPMEHPFVQSAYQAGKYAFVADYVRLWVLYNEGGVYFDTDILLLKSINDLLDYNLFIGLETKASINASILGAVNQNYFIKTCINYYDNLKFDAEILPKIAIPIILTKIYTEYQHKETIKVFEPEYFYPYPFEARTNGDLNIWKYITSNSYCIHLWDASWIPNFSNVLGTVETSKISLFFKIVKQNFVKLFNRKKE